MNMLNGITFLKEEELKPNFCVRSLSVRGRKVVLNGHGISLREYSGGSPSRCLSAYKNTKGINSPCPRYYVLMHNNVIIYST